MSVTDALILAAAVTLTGYLHASLRPAPQAATHAEVWVEGEHYRRLPLDRAQSLEVRGALGTTTVEVADGGVRVTDSPGRRKLCVRAGWLRDAGESAVCLPNRVVISVEGADSQLDAINQ